MINTIKVPDRYQDSNITRMLQEGSINAKDLEPKEDKTFITYSTDDKVFHMYLTDVITGPEDYNNVFDVLNSAKEDETIRIYIVTPGGRQDTTNMLKGLAQVTKATTVAVIGDVASAGTVLALSFDNLEVLPNIEFMVHNYSGMSGGKGHEMYAQIDYLKEEMPKVFKNYYKDFLTEEECNTVISGQDLYLNADQVEEKWQNVLDVRQAEVDKFEGESAKAQGAAMAEYLVEQGYTIKPPTKKK